MAHNKRRKSVNPKHLVNPDIVPTKRNYWKPAYIVLCFLLLGVTILTFISVLLSPGMAWDYNVYMGTIDVINQNRDPYIPENIQEYTGSPIPIVYPPHTFVLFDIFYMINNPFIYLLFLVILVVISAYLSFKMDDNSDKFFFFVLVSTGFIAMFWNLMSGNYAFIFMFLITLFLYWFKKEQYYKSAIAVGIMASLSFIPFLFTTLFLFSKRKFNDNIKLIVISGLIVCFIFIISYVISPSLTQSFFNYTFSQESSIVNELKFTSAGMSNPTSYMMFGYILHNAILTGVISLVYIGLVLYAAYLFMQKSNNIFKTHCFWLLSIIMILPRFKPYSFVMAIIPLYFLLKDYDYKVKTIAFIGISVIPLITYNDYFMEFVWLPDILLFFGQTISLFFIYLYIYYLNSKVILNSSVVK